MPSYVVLGNYTDQGIKNVKEVKNRVAAVRQSLESSGGRLIFWYLTFGAYDFISVVEVPDRDAVARLLLSVGAQGNVRTATMEALTEEEAFAIADALP
jgi:uncharacterized protein with GYD domain